LQPIAAEKVDTLRALLFKLLLPFVAIIGVVRPLYGLCIYLAFSVVRPEMFFWGNRSANMIFKVSMVASLIGYLRLKPNPRSVTSYREFWLLLWIWVACAVSLLMTDVPLEPKAWTFSTEILKLWVLGLLILGVAYKKEHLFQLQYVSLACVSFLSLWAIDQHFRGNERLEGLGGGILW